MNRMVSIDTDHARLPIGRLAKAAMIGLATIRHVLTIS